MSGRNVLYARVPPVVLAWVDDQAEAQGISQAEFITVLLKSLMINYSDRELKKIILGLKPSLTKRDVVRDPETRELKRNMKINLD
jgi:hypothetical protein